MGAFYGSILIKSKDVAQIKTVLETLVRDSDDKFLVGPPLKGWVSIFPSGNGQDISISERIAGHIHADMFQLFLHDDDIFAYHFYRNGILRDQYNSCPDYFESASEEEKQKESGKPEVFADLLKDRSDLRRIKALLKAEKSDRFIFESRRMEEFVKLVGLPNAVGSYEYFLDGERQGIRNWKKFFEVPDLREAKRRARLELKATKKLLHAEGLFLAELLPSGPKKEGIRSHPHCCADTLNGGFLIAWASAIHQTSEVPLLSFNPLESKIPVETGMSFYERFFSFEMSPSGKWFVASFGNIEIWDWAQRSIVFEIEATSYISDLRFTNDERHLIGADSLKIMIASLETGLIEHKFKIGSGGRANTALHPDGVYLVVISLNNLALLNLATGEIEKTLEHKFTITHYLPPEDYTETMMEVINEITAGKISLKSDSAVERLLAGSRLSGRNLSIRVSEGMVKFQFNQSGDLLYCATNRGLRVFRWSEILIAVNEAPTPIFSANAPTEDPNGDYVHDFFLDERRNHIIFCGSFGKVCYLNLNTGKSGILLAPPEDMRITSMALSKEKVALCCTCAPPHYLRNREISRLQFWNYPALCKAAGLP